MNWAQGINPQPEKISSYELVYEQGDRALPGRSSVSGYYDRMDNLINLESGSFTNIVMLTSLGLNSRSEGRWEYDIRTRLSYTLQHSENRATDAGLPDSPMHLVKFNVSAPLYADKIFAGLEIQYTSSSHTVFSDLSGGTQSGAGIRRGMPSSISRFLARIS